MVDYREIISSEYDQIDHLRAYCFRKKYEGERLADFHDWVKRGTNVGAFDEDGQLTSQVLIFPLKMMVQTQIYSMGGIAFVASYPEHSGKGQISRLMRLALEKMYEHNQIVSMLNPFSIAFYRKFGWEIFFSRINYELPVGRFGKTSLVAGTFKRTSFDDPVGFKVVTEIFNTYCLNASGRVVRDHYWWQRLKRREENTQFVVYLDTQGSPCGFIRYSINDRTFIICDFIVLNHQAELALWQFVYAHASMIECVTGSASAHLPINLDFRETGFSQQMVHDMMFRVVNVQAFLENYPFLPHHQPLIVVINDPQAEWNHRTFVIETSGEVANKPYDEKNKSALVTDIGSFSSMMINYQRPFVFGKYQRVIAEEDILQQWEHAIPHVLPEMYDHF